MLEGNCEVHHLLRAARPPGLFKHLGDIVSLDVCRRAQASVDSLDFFTSELVCRDVNIKVRRSPRQHQMADGSFGFKLQ